MSEASRVDWFPSRWGADDDVGALNEISGATVLRALRLVREGRVYDLSQTLEPGIPVHPFHGPFHYATYRRHSESLSLFDTKNRLGAMNVRLEMPDHVGTHLDGLNHPSIGDLIYNGRRSEDVVGVHGTTRLGMEKTPPIVTRGVLLDVASAQGVERLEGGYAISREDVESTLRKDGVKLERGDALLVATGWAQLWMRDNARYSSSCPGIGLEAARWVADQGVAVVGADTWNVEVEPAETEGSPFVVHQTLTTRGGVRLLENMNLEGLRRSSKAKEFLFVCLPLRIRGGSASPVTPAAVV
jgi:kynurenine formamidase